jgi:predicted MFS family arabinose efflux permease
MLSTAPIAFLSDHVSEDNRAQAIALHRTCGDVGFLVGASTVGALADVTSMGYAMQSTSALLLTGTTWFTVRQVLARKKKKSAVNSTK